MLQNVFPASLIMNIEMNHITGVPTSSDYLTNFATNPRILIIITVVIIVYYALFATLGVTGGVSSGDVSTSSSSSGNGLLFLDILLWALFIVLVMLNGMTYLFNFDISASIKNLLTNRPEIDIIVDNEDSSSATSVDTTVPEIKFYKEVFHIPDNKYTYENAKAICKAYGGRLATYKELEEAYDAGADWCGYGWSDGQMALFPTQYDKWAYLQTIDGHEHDCGRPGINGGFIDNENVQFGVNCYGHKPEITKEEVKLMESTPLYPKTKKEMNFEKRVAYWKNKLPDILVSPFNHNNWSIL